jgi:hypothetical protein
MVPFSRSHPVVLSSTSRDTSWFDPRRWAWAMIAYEGLLHWDMYIAKYCRPFPHAIVKPEEATLLSIPGSCPGSLLPVDILRSSDVYQGSSAGPGWDDLQSAPSPHTCLQSPHRGPSTCRLMHSAP